jgi:hypothetical protein
MKNISPKKNIILLSSEEDSEYTSVGGGYGYGYGYESNEK